MQGISATAARFACAALLAFAWPSTSAQAQAFPGCIAAANETLLQWPVENPVWQMCWLRPSQSSGPRGSGLEVRNVFYRGKQVFKRAHAPMLFAEYRNGAGGNCYRDWKDSNSPFLANPAVQNQIGIGENVITSCDRSTSPTQSFGNCPFALGSPGPGGSTCFSGVAIQERGDRVTLTTQYVAGWYLYSMRWTFHLDGTIEPFFGLGNSNGTYNTVTHWHHNYWRFDFDIEGAGNDQLLLDRGAQATEFTALHAPGRVYGVRDSVTGRGYDILPGSATTPPGAMDLVFPPNESGRNFHTVDVMGTAFANNEFGDNPNYSLSDCGVNVAALVTPSVSINNTDVVLYYRGGVRDSAGDFPAGSPVPADPMVCKSVGPRMVPVGDWSAGDENIFRNGFEN
ncbi:MAG: hypothetical protein MUE46_14870 [Xanthomonadales bacterium]|nr:hypothetical protein [Xanthomonadales bacterium]